MHKISITLLSVVLAVPASAQIFSNSVIMGMGYTAQAGVSQTPVLHCLKNACGNSRRTAAPESSAGNLVGLAFKGNGESSATTAMDLSYRPSAATQKQVQAEFLSRLEAKDPAAAKQVSSEFARLDIDRVFNGLLGGTGLRADNLADILASYTALGYLIANNDMGDPDPAGLRALRDQIAPRLAANPRTSGPSVRAKVGEELKLLFVTLHAGWLSAKKEGNLTQYSAGVARLFQQQGGADLRRVALTDRGFVPR